MCAYRTNLRRLLCLLYISAVAALPAQRSIAFEGISGLISFQKLAVALLMSGLYTGNTFKLNGKLFKAFLSGLSGHAAYISVHS